MESLIDGLAIVGFTALLTVIMVLLIRVFHLALSHQSKPELSAQDDIHNFDYSESHRLLMEREDIVQMTYQGYYDPMDQVFSLERWKQKVARYMHNYDCYLSQKD